MNWVNKKNKTFMIFEMREWWKQNKHNSFHALRMARFKRITQLPIERYRIIRHYQISLQIDLPLNVECIQMYARELKWCVGKQIGSFASNLWLIQKCVCVSIRVVGKLHKLRGRGGTGMTPNVPTSHAYSRFISEFSNKLLYLLTPQMCLQTDKIIFFLVSKYD